MFFQFLARYADQVLAVTRILFGINFATHGAQKLFGVLGGAPAGMPLPMLYTAGGIEFFGGLLIAVGFFTRPAAFVSSGLMAVAYFTVHQGRDFWPISNGGELAIAYCWLFLFLSTYGGGAWSLDALQGPRKAAQRGTDRLALGGLEARTVPHGKLRMAPEARVGLGTPALPERAPALVRALPSVDAARAEAHGVGVFHDVSLPGYAGVSRGGSVKYLHTMVRVRDLDASLDFYCNKLGLVELRRHEVEAGRFTLVFLAAAGDEEAQVELTYNWDPEPLDGGRNFGHLAYQVEDIYETCRQLADGGVTINRPPRDGYMASCARRTASRWSCCRRAGRSSPRSPGSRRRTWASGEDTGQLPLRGHALRGGPGSRSADPVPLLVVPQGARVGVRCVRALPRRRGVPLGRGRGSAAHLRVEPAEPPRVLQPLRLSHAEPAGRRRVGTHGHDRRRPRTEARPAHLRRVQGTVVRDHRRQAGVREVGAGLRGPDDE